MKSVILFLAILLCSTSPFSPTYCYAADENSKLDAAFNELCSQTENAESLSVEVITSMISECDILKEKITKSSHPKKKVLLFRLKKCRNFLDFILQTKQLTVPPAE